MVEKIFRFLSAGWQSFLSILKILLYSKWKTGLPRVFTNQDELVILANGPSLNKTITESADFLKGKTLLAVNFFVLSPLYDELKPEVYLIADPLFWIVPEKRISLFETLANKTTWDVSFFIPYRAFKNKDWQPFLSNHPHIRVYAYNTTPVEGYQCFCNRVYASGLGVPRPHNVLIPSIVMALNLSFQKVYLAGADHSWLTEISVTDENEVLVHQKHFYDRKTSKAEVVLKENLESASLYTILHHMSVAFKSYFTIKAYANSLKKEVINITPESFIDAFKRLKL